MPNIRVIFLSAVAFPVSMMLCGTVHAQSCDGVDDPDRSPAEKHLECLEQTVTEKYEQTVSDIDVIFSEPQSALEAGCLDDLWGIDLSVFSIDPAGLAKVIYEEVRRRIVTGVCTAATDWANEQTQKLYGEISDPTGIFSIETRRNRLSNSDWKAINNDDWGRLVETDYEVPAREIDRYVSKDLLRDLPGPRASSRASRALEREGVIGERTTTVVREETKPLFDFKKDGDE